MKNNYLNPAIPKEIVGNIISIYLFGSSTRGEQDEYSDYDVFLCIKDCKDEEYFSIKNIIEETYKHTKYEFSIYQISSLTEMHKKGSYFLWHLKNEGIQIYDKNCTLAKLLNSLPRYKKTFEDFQEYYDILLDIKESVESNDFTPTYELSILATLARNVCIGLCYLHGEMVFGRVTPVEKCKEYYSQSFPFNIDEYLNLYKYRLFENRKNLDLGINKPNKEYINNWIIKVEKLITLAKMRKNNE